MIKSPGSSKRQIVLGWLAVGLNLFVACLWAFWGTIEAFHEGWFHRSVWVNVLWLFRYTAPMWIAILLGLICLFHRKIGSRLYGIVWLALGLFLGSILLRSNLSLLKILFTLVFGGFGGLTALLWWFGNPEPRKLAIALTAGLPITIALMCAAEPIYRIAARHDDGKRGIRLVEGNGVRLLWAGEGPGWPLKAVQNWDDAKRICRYLSKDGTHLMETPQGFWRLPTIEEAVHSMTRHGKNAGGEWNAGQERASYTVRPDKESPLWNPYSEIIYWWTATETDPQHAYIIVYNGGVYVRPKSMRMGTLGFRAVREAGKNEPAPN